ELGFDGIVISDDIGMAAATGMGDVAARVHAHLDAGCDLVLACTPDLVADALAACDTLSPGARDPVSRLQGRGDGSWRQLIANPAGRRPWNGWPMAPCWPAARLETDMNKLN